MTAAPHQVCVSAGRRASHYVPTTGGPQRKAACGFGPGLAAHWVVLAEVLTASCPKCRATMAKQQQKQT